MKRHILLTLVLTLHCAAWAWQPAPDSMLTEWGAKLTPETAWQEYPRPALARSAWSNLNGLWNLAIAVGADTVTSYVGLRETTVAKDADGHLRLFLNGKPLFHFGPLDQGWWPDGLLTPPSDAAMRSDIDTCGIPRPATGVTAACPKTRTNGLSATRRPSPSWRN